MNEILTSLKYSKWDLINSTDLEKPKKSWHQQPLKPPLNSTYASYGLSEYKIPVRDAWTMPIVWHALEVFLDNSKLKTSD